MRHLINFPTPIQHVVVISMENRTVDNLFAGMYNKPWSGAGGGSWGTALDLHDPSAPPTLTANSLSAFFDPNHLHAVGWSIESRGLWSEEPYGCKGKNSCPAGATALSYVPTSETGVYQALLENWAFASNVLQANEGPSFVAHQYYIAGQSGGLPNGLNPPNAEAENPRPTISPPGLGNYAETIQDAQGDVSGCDVNSELMRTVNMFLTPPPQSQPPYPDLDNGQPFTHPCENYNTILDEIVTAQKDPHYYDWQYIAATPHSIWAAPLGVSHLFQEWSGGNYATQPFAVDPDASNFVANLTGTPSPNPVRPFATLTYITPCIHESDHPIMGGSDDGPAWLAWVVNAIGHSRYWYSTVIFVTWDDWGGWYDHIPNVPNPGPVRPLPNHYNNNPMDPNEWGFRVPLIIISPYVKQAGYVSNYSTSGAPYRSQSIMLKFIENVFTLSPLNGDDTQQNSKDWLQDAFDFNRSPLPYVPVNATGFTPAKGGTCAGGFPSYRRSR